MKKNIIIFAGLLIAPWLWGQTGAPYAATPPAAAPEATEDHQQALDHHLKWQDEITDWRIDHLRALRTLAEAQAAIFGHEAILEEHAAHIARHGRHIAQHELAREAGEVVDPQAIEERHQRLMERHQRLAESHGKLEGQHGQLAERIAALRVTLDEVHGEIAAALDEALEERGVFGERLQRRDDYEGDETER